MDHPESATPNTDICGRCGQLVMPENNRCPRCGSPITMRFHHWPILFGIAGVLALLFVVYLMVMVVQNDEDHTTPDPTAQTP